MVYRYVHIIPAKEEWKTLRPSDIYPSKETVQRVLQETGVRITSFRVPKQGERIITKYGGLMTTSNNWKDGWPRLIVEPVQLTNIDDFWE